MGDEVGLATLTPPTPEILLHMMGKRGGEEAVRRQQHKHYASSLVRQADRGYVIGEKGGKKGKTKSFTTDCGVLTLRLPQLLLNAGVLNPEFLFKGWNCYHQS